MENVRLTQVRSSNNSTDSQKATLMALRLGKISRSHEVTLNDVVKGQIAAVSHLIKVEPL